MLLVMVAQWLRCLPNAWRIVSSNPYDTKLPLLAP